MDHSFMIEGLEKVLEGSDQPGVAELRDLLQKLLNGHEASGRFLEQATLQPREPDRERVSAAVELVAQMHTRFAEHALLGEVRLHGGDLGIRFYESNVRDAIYALEACQPAAQQNGLRDRLLHRLCKLRDE